jgi:hypothetical protein
MFRGLAAELRLRHRARLASRLAEEIIAHMAGEESVLYPAARQAFRGDRRGENPAEDRNALRDSRDLHLALRLQLRRFLETDVGDVAFPDVLATLREVFDQHLRSQEEELFPRLEAVLGPVEVEALGEQVVASRPPVWIVTTDGRGLAGATGSPAPRALRTRLSLPSTR